MIEQFIYLYPAVTRYIASMPSLAGYAIMHKEFEVLNDILQVLDCAHYTQELLSSDKTPTLSFALPLYHALIAQWRDLQTKLPALSDAIDASVKKIGAYIAKSRSNPAHIVAMVLNPSIQYDWIAQNTSSEEEAEKEVKNAQAVVKAYMLRYLEDQQCREKENQLVITGSHSQAFSSPS
ncbi:hypothetical protein FRC11_001907 [Ceratobasidium sp. 423]|nr:hypothetical protein FRC11_001907 [Ceratobasidium sp. 423]